MKLAITMPISPFMTIKGISLRRRMQFATLSMMQLDRLRSITRKAGVCEVQGSFGTPIGMYYEKMSCLLTLVR
jgi:hypothetical protein